MDEPDQSEPDGSPQEGRSDAGPPEDPESWTDDQWIAWLDATDDPDATDPDAVTPKHWSRGRSASMLGAAMLGLHEVIYGPHGNEIAIVVDAGGDPPGDDLPEVRLDPDHPERSEVIVRRTTSEPSAETPDPPPAT